MRIVRWLAIVLGVDVILSPIGMALLACSGDGPASLVPRVQRAIEPRPGSLSTADLDWVEIGTETRLVLAAHPSKVLRWREDVELPDDLRVEVTLPAELEEVERVRIDTWVSVPDPADRGKGLWERRVQEFVRRLTLDATPIIVRQDVAEPDSSRVVITVPVPPEARGLSGLLNVVARPLSRSAVERQETRTFQIPRGARLVFGYGIEEPGWTEGWPPVHFRVSAVDETNSAPVHLFERRIDPSADPRDRRWFDASVDLTPVVGRKVRFVFEAEAMGDVPGASIDRSFPVVSNPEVVVRRETPRDRDKARSPPNIVLISLDTLRAKSVSAYGYHRATTPALDRRLAAAGALIRFAVVPVPFTPSSHMSMLTGLEPCIHRVKGRNDVLAVEQITLAEVLRAAGYKTAAFTENAYVVAAAGFARGFDKYVEHRSEETAAPGFVDETFRAATRWLLTTDDHPFFLFVHTYQVHAPYTPPRAYQNLFIDGLAEEYPEKHRDSVTNYDREIRYTDDVLAGFLNELDARGLAEQTIVVVTSDHGEAFGEHSRSAHGSSIYDEALLVPLVMRAPGLVRAGLVIEEQVGLIDLMPTLLDLVDVPLPSEVQGRSFASLLTGRGDRYFERPLVSSALDIESVRTRQYKYMKKTGPKPDEALFHLQVDPGERTNVSALDLKTLTEAREVLAEHHKRCETWLAKHPASSGTRARVENRPGWRIHRDEIDRKLKSLGYVD